MDVFRHEIISWEPLRLEYVGDNHSAANLERFTLEWLQRRDSSGRCPCITKTFRMHVEEQYCVAYCEFMCDSCLKSYAEDVQRNFPDVSALRIGEATQSDATASPGGYITVGAQTVELEDGGEVFVDTYSIKRDAVTTSKFSQFVKTTGFVSTAERLGLSDTYLSHCGMSPHESERVESKVGCVSFFDAQSYCDWHGAVRLPTEAEWVAAALVDHRVFDRWEDRDILKDETGRLRFSHVPRALRNLGCEWTSTEEDDLAVVRCGPLFIRYVDWKDPKRPPRRLVSKDETSFSVSFRLVLT